MQRTAHIATVKHNLLDRLEHAVLEGACEIGNWNLTAVGRALGTDRRTVYRMVARHELVRPAHRVLEWEGGRPKRQDIAKPAILRAVAEKLIKAAEALEAQGESQ